MKRKLVCMCFGMAVFGMVLSGCGEGKNGKDNGDSGQSEVDVESYDFSQDKSFDITAGGIQAAEDTVTLAMQKMADEVKEKSGGTITITVSPAAQLGDATSQMEAVSLGTQEMFVDAGSWLSTFVDDAQVTSMFSCLRMKIITENSWRAISMRIWSSSSLTSRESAWWPITGSDLPDLFPVPKKFSHWEI